MDLAARRPQALGYGEPEDGRKAGPNFASYRRSAVNRET